MIMPIHHFGEAYELSEIRIGLLEFWASLPEGIPCFRKVLSFLLDLGKCQLITDLDGPREGWGL